jgi:hypothetical protein
VHFALAQTVRFSQSFDEDAPSDGEEGLRRALSSRPPLAPSGGSVSLAAQHFCPVCGIIATSQANLEVREMRLNRLCELACGSAECVPTQRLMCICQRRWAVLSTATTFGSWARQAPI